MWLRIDLLFSPIRLHLQPRSTQKALGVRHEAIVRTPKTERPRTNIRGRAVYYFLTYFLKFLVPVSPA